MAATTRTALPLGAHALGSYPRYEQAQRAVDYLSDQGFPVEKTTIVGADLRLVETITGRLTRGRCRGRRLFGFLAHAATHGQRDFSSRSGLAATRYGVLVEADAATEAERLLSLMP